MCGKVRVVENGGGGGHQGRTDVRETENPNVSGCSAKRRFRIVDLPEPEGPEMTIGRVEVILAVVVWHQSMGSYR